MRIALASLLLAIPAAAQQQIYGFAPQLECVATASAEERVFYDRSHFEFCVPVPSQYAHDWYGRWDWEIELGTAPGFAPLHSTSLPQAAIDVPIWSRFRVRYRPCSLYSEETCHEWSTPSVWITALPNIDLDGSGSVSIFDLTRVCRDGAQRVLNRRLSGGEYVVP